MGRIATFLSAFRIRGEEDGNEMKLIIASKDKVLKEYGDSRLLVRTMAEKEFEKISQEKLSGIRAKVKTGSNGGASTGKAISQKTSQQQEKNVDRDNGERDR